MGAETALERTIRDPALTTASQPGDQLFLSVFSKYACLHLLDADQTLRYLQSQPLSENTTPETALPLAEWEQAGLEPELLIDTPHVTLIPASLYQPSMAEAYAKLNFGHQPNSRVATNYLPQTEAYVLFTYQPAEWPLHREKFAEPAYHVATPWLASLSVQFHKVKAPVLCFDVADPYLRVAVLQEGRLQLFNTYTIRQTSDLLYYLAAVARATNLDLHHHAVYASGLVFRHSNRFKQLYRYIRYLRFQHRVSSLTYTHQLDKVPEHLFYNLLGIPLCAS